MRAVLLLLGACSFESKTIPDSGSPPLPDTGLADAAACTDLYEPNDDFGEAFSTPVALESQTFPITGTLCPNDVDLFSIVTDRPDLNLEVTAVWDSGPGLTVVLTNSAGQAIALGNQDGVVMSRACAANLPVGTYLAAIIPNDEDATETTPYEAEIAVVAACGP